VRWIAAITLLLAAGAARAQLETDGPFDSRVRLELSDRVRYERVDFFRTAPDSAIRNYDYGFFENRLQVGLRILRDPLEIFVQYQNSLLTSLPENAPGPGGSYFANTPEVNQEKGILRNAGCAGSPFDARACRSNGRQLFREAQRRPRTDAACAETGSPSAWSARSLPTWGAASTAGLASTTPRSTRELRFVPT
jgi:hypothetical protein